MSESWPESLPESKNVDQCAYTNIEDVKCRYMWKIKNPAHIGQDLISPVFDAKLNEHNVKWQLILELKPSVGLSSDDPRSKLNLLLHSADDKCVRFNWNAVVKQSCGLEHYQRHYTDSGGFEAKKPGDQRSIKLPFTKRELERSSNEYIIDNVLTIVVNITMVACSQPQTCMVTITKPNCTLIEDVVKLCLNPELSDATIIVGDSKFPVHKALLAARSDVFAAMFQHELAENKTNQIIIDDFDSSVICEMLHYIYTGQSTKISEMAGELLTAAEKYNLRGLKEACLYELTSNINIGTVVQALILADLNSVDLLKQQSIDFINANSAAIIKTAAFREMVKMYPHIALDIIERLQPSCI